MSASRRSGLALSAIATALSCLGVLGCSGKGGSQKACYPVKGQVFVKSQPADGATVILSPRDAKAEEWSSGYPHARVAADGSFEVGTYAEKDGAPTGEYVILVRWPAKNPNPDAEEVDGPDRLREKYSDPGSSKLNAKVEAKPTELPAIRIP